MRGPETDHRLGFCGLRSRNRERGEPSQDRGRKSPDLYIWTKMAFGFQVDQESGKVSFFSSLSISPTPYQV